MEVIFIGRHFDNRPAFSVSNFHFCFLSTVENQNAPKFIKTMVLHTNSSLGYQSIQTRIYKSTTKVCCSPIICKFMYFSHIATLHAASKPTEIEIREQAYLKREILTYNDIHIAPFRDQYLDISNKLISLLRFGYYQTEAEYIAEHDDEYCLNVKTALGIIRQHELYDNSKELYAGTNLFRGDEYLSMQGTNGLIAPYFSGW